MDSPEWSRKKKLLLRAQELHRHLETSNGSTTGTDSGQTSSIEQVDAVDSSATTERDQSRGPMPHSVSALVSWAHKEPEWSDDQSDNWRDLVLSFAAALRNPGGIDADIDLYHSDDLEIDWTRFGPSLIEECDFTFVVISKAWGDRWSGKNDPTTGAGAVGEADTLKGMFQSTQREFQRRVKCILLPGITDSLIPQDLKRLSRYYVDPENFDTFQDLLRAVTNQPSIIKPDVSAVPFLPTSIASKTRVSSNNTPRKNPDSLANLQIELRVSRRRHAQLIHADPIAHAQEIEKLEEYIAVLGSLADSVYNSDLD